MLHSHSQHAVIPHSPTTGRIARVARIQTLRGQPEGLSRARAIPRMGVRVFNTEGPVEPPFHFCISPLQRANLEEILNLVRRKEYSVLHAPRKMGKA